MTMVPVMAMMATMPLSIRRNSQACQNDECDNTKKHGADLHILLFFTACLLPGRAGLQAALSLSNTLSI
jgi:hypothetical protein